MNPHEIDTVIRDRPVNEDDREQSFVVVEGIEGTTLRATRTELIVCPRPSNRSRAGDGRRRWGYGELSEVRLDAYGPVGVVRATIHATGHTLPLLLLEPDQIAAARRTLEIVRNLMSSSRTGNHAA